MNTAIAILVQELATKQAAFTTNEIAKTELLKTINIDQVDIQGNDFADKYAVILKASQELTSQITDLQQAIFYAKRALR